MTHQVGTWPPSAPIAPYVPVQAPPWEGSPGMQPGSSGDIVEDFTAYLEDRWRTQAEGLPPAAPTPGEPGSRVPWGSQPAITPPAGPGSAPPLLPTPADAASSDFDYGHEGGKHWSGISAIAGGIVGAVTGGGGRYGPGGLGGAALGAALGVVGGAIGGYVTGWLIGTAVDKTGGRSDESHVLKGAIAGAVIGTAQLALTAALSKGSISLGTKLNPVFGAIGGAFIGSHLSKVDDPPKLMAPRLLVQ